MFMSNMVMIISKTNENKIVAVSSRNTFLKNIVVIVQE